MENKEPDHCAVCPETKDLSLIGGTWLCPRHEDIRWTTNGSSYYPDVKENES